MSKKREDPTCPQCGTSLRGRATCPRGTFCAQFAANEEFLNERVREAFPDWRRKPDPKAPAHSGGAFSMEAVD